MAQILFAPAGSTAGVVTSVSGTSPITSSGGTTPTIGIDAATPAAAGSMSAADKTKLDGITAGAAVASVSGTSPITSSGGTTPTIGLGTVGVANGGTGLTTTPTNGQLLIGNGAGYTQAALTAGSGISITNGAGSVSIAATATSAQSIALDAAATDATPAFIGTVYVPQPTTLTVASVAYFGGSVVSDTTTLELVPAGGGPAVATWTRTGLLGSQALASPATIASAGWYDLVLTPGASGTAFARGLYLV